MRPWILKSAVFLSIFYIVETSILRRAMSDQTVKFRSIYPEKMKKQYGKGVDCLLQG